MPAESHDQQLARELMRLGVTSRLKGAPKYHFWDIGEGKREAFKGLEAALIAFQKREMKGENLTPKEQAAYEQLRTMFADPEVNPYSMKLYNEDEQTSASRRLYVQYTYQAQFFVLTDSEQTAQQITEHFYPIRWAEFNEASDWELFREAIPAMQVARAQLKVYEEQRWLYDERSQRAAEVLSYRIQHKHRGKLKDKLDTSEQQRKLFEEYSERLERGTNPRRWFQETVAKLTGASRKSAK